MYARPSGNSWLDAVPLPVERNQLVHPAGEQGAFRTRSHYSHFSLENIEQQGQPNESKAAENPANRRIGAAILPDAPEAVHLKRYVMEAYAGFVGQYWSFGNDSDQHCDRPKSGEE